MKRTLKTNNIAFSSLMTALSVILYLLSNVPILQIFGTLLCPLPLILVGIKNGKKFLILSSIVSIFIVFLILGPIQAYFYFSLFVSVSIILGISIIKDIKPIKIILAGTLIMMILNIFFYYGVEKVFGLEDFLKEFSKMTENFVPKMIAYTSFNNNLEQQKALIDYIISIFQRLIEVPIFLFTIVSFATIYVNYMMCLLIFPKFDIKLKPIEPIFLWKAPWWLLAAYFLVNTIKLYPPLNPTKFTDAIYLNFNFIFITAYFLFGLGIINFYVLRFKMPGLLKLLIMIIAYFNFFYVSILGILDTFLDIRGLSKYNKIKKQ